LAPCTIPPPQNNNPKNIIENDHKEAELIVSQIPVAKIITPATIQYKNQLSASAY
jgi:hypothetical protein